MTIQSTHIIISEKNQLAAIYNHKKLKELEISHSKFQVGNIYVGLLETFRPNISAAFITLDKTEKNGFIQLHNLVPIKLKQKCRKDIDIIQRKSKLLVQVVKEPTGAKGPTLTTHIGIIGKYLILLPFGDGISISKKLYSHREKQHLKCFFTLLKPNSVGILIKKEAYKVSELQLRKDLESIQNDWANISRKVRHIYPPSLVTSKPDFLSKMMYNFYTANTTKISVDSNYEAWKVYYLVTNESTKKRPRKLIIEYYHNKLSMVESFFLDITIYATLQPRINLITGGHIIIEKTEALTAIDINSGSFNHLTNSRATLLWINCEAATEIARQLKLRNIGGIIVVDFIDMLYQRDQMTLLNHFYNSLKKDNGNPKIIQLSEIGLVELTRKRKGQNIYDIFGHKCSKCSGIGQCFNLQHINTVHRSKIMLSLETGSIFLYT